MTGRLRNLNGPQIISDHERRIRDLERQLRSKQTDPPRRPPGGGGALAYLRAELSTNQDLTDVATLAYDAVQDEWGDGSITALAGGDPGQWALAIGGTYIVSAGMVLQGTPDALTDPGWVDLRLVGISGWSYWGHEPCHRSFVDVNDFALLTVCSVFHIQDDVTGTPGIWAQGRQVLTPGLDVVQESSSFITITRIA